MFENDGKKLVAKKKSGSVTNRHKKSHIESVSNVSFMSDENKHSIYGELKLSSMFITEMNTLKDELACEQNLRQSLENKSILLIKEISAQKK